MFLETSDKRSKTIQTFSERDIFPVVPAATLLRSTQREKILNDIRQFSGAPDEPYEELYKKLIIDFAEFVQLLPSNNEARLGSLLDEGLLRGLYVLQLHHQEAQQGKEIEPVMNYVVFSAALMFDIGCVIENRTVVISDRDGGFVRCWLPYEGPMCGTDGYYKIRRGGGIPAWVSKKITTLLARQLLPETGFQWIAEDSYALNIWLALLNNDHDSSGAFGMIFDKAIELLNIFKNSQDFFLMPFDIDVVESEANAAAEEFLEWLRKNLEEKKLSINEKNSLVHLTDKGLFLDKDLIKKFAEAFKKRTLSFATVYQQMRNLGFISGELKKYAYAAQVRHGAPFAGIGKVVFGSGGLFSGAAKPTAAASAAVKKEGVMIPRDSKTQVPYAAMVGGALAKAGASPSANLRPAAAAGAGYPSAQAAAAKVAAKR